MILGDIHFYNFCYKKLRISLMDGKWIILCKQYCKIWLDVLINCTKSSFMDVVDFIIKFLLWQIQTIELYVNYPLQAVL